MTAANSNNFQNVSSLLQKIGGFSGSGAEISAFDPESQRLFVVSGGAEVQVLDLSDPTNPTLVNTLDLSTYGDGAASVAIKNGLVAIAVAADPATEPGKVVFLDTEGNFQSSIGVGALPDMLTFTPDGSKVLVANEGEPSEDYTVDPEGSISIIDLSAGVENATVTTADFQGFNDRKAELLAKGVRIFGAEVSSEDPNDTVSVAQDLEPEYIAIAPDGTTALATLQENNAVAVVDLETAEVVDILPLGYKDHSQGQPTLEQIPFTDLPLLGTTPAGQEIKLGGLSGLFYEGTDPETGNLKFVTVPDRGPNGAPTDVDGDGEEERPFVLPDYQARVLRFELNPDSNTIHLRDSILLTRADGETPITGLPNLEGIDEAPVDLEGNLLPLDEFGADLEGIVVAPDGSFWMVDEYRPAIYHFDSNGVLIDRFVPQGTAALAEQPEGTYGSETLPAEYATRRDNRGFEAMALDTDTGILYAFIQTPLANPDRDASDSSDVIRMLGIDPATGEPVAEYVYLLEDAEARPGGRVDKMGDAVYAGDGTFYTVERDSEFGTTAKKPIFKIDLKGATNLLAEDAPSLPEGKTLEQLTNQELADLGIQPVNKINVVNPPSLGYDAGDKIEGLALLEDGRLAILNDNDFGLLDQEIPVDGSVALNPNPVQITLGLIDLGSNNKLDASDRDGADGEGAINIQNYPIFGMYQPDAIASFAVGEQTYYVTANEGDARLRPTGDDEIDGLEEGDIFNEESRVKDLVLDPTAFPNAEELQKDENLGRLLVTNTKGDLDGDGDFDQLFAYGARSFSIWDEFGNLVYDSGDDFEQITAVQVPELFNSEGDPEDFDSRSDNKGPEPEAVATGTINDRTYAFIGLERTGGVMVYEVTNPQQPQFLQYLPNQGDDRAPEGLLFIPASDSPNDKPLLVISNEVSSSVTVLEVNPQVRISDIQGTGHRSPLVDQTVTAVPGIVTAVDRNGFYLQDPNPDGNEATSEAVFVFTGDAPTVSVGDAVEVSGTVSEFVPGGAESGNLSTTQIGGEVTVEVLSSDNPLPAAVTLGEGGRVPPTEIINNDADGSLADSPFDPSEDGIDFYESLEGMRVTVQDAIAVSPSNQFGEIFTLANQGANATGVSERGTINISPEDFNPERIQVQFDDDLLPDFEAEVNVGATLGDVTGVVGYSFGNFEVNVTEPFTASESELEPEVTELTGSENQLTVASYNVLNLDPKVEDPTLTEGGEDDVDDDLGNGQFEAIAAQIVNNLKLPDVIGLQEIQDNNGAEITDVTAANETLQRLVDKIAELSGVNYEFIDNPFIGNETSGGQPGGNIRNAFLYNPDRVSFVEDLLRTVTDPEDQQTNPENPFYESRLPLAATFTFNGEAVTVVSNHFSSKGGSAPLFGQIQPATELQEDPEVNGGVDDRRVQAAAVKEFVDEILAADASANVVVLGDLNEFEFISPIDLLEESLTNLTETLPENERYSYIFQGNSQSLDHILASSNLSEQAEFDAVHVNSEFADQASDHDPLLARFTLSATETDELLNGGGTDTADSVDTEMNTIANSQATLELNAQPESLSKALNLLTVSDPLTGSPLLAVDGSMAIAI
ncbi:MAG: hypothetical protein Kow00121_13510 [Elainellaceae cyanobacterium]